MQDVALDVWNLGGLSQHSCPCSLHCPISGHKAILQGQTSQKFVDRTWNHEQGCLLISSKALEFIVVLQDLLEPSSQNTTEKQKWCTSAFLRGFIEVEVGSCASVRAWICHVTVCLLQRAAHIHWHPFLVIAQGLQKNQSNALAPTDLDTAWGWKINSKLRLKESRKVKVEVKRMTSYAVTDHGDALTTTIAFSFTFSRRSKVVFVASKILGWKWSDIALSLQ